MFEWPNILKFQWWFGKRVEAGDMKEEGEAGGDVEGEVEGEVSNSVNGNL